MINSSVLFLRHGQSTFNEGYITYSNHTHPRITWQQCLQIPRFNKEVSYHPRHIDCSLTPKGIEQCARAKNQLTTTPINYILVSPFYRALQTRSLVFDPSIPTKVIPQLGQILRFSCDLSEPIAKKREQFPTYDFSSIKNDMWFIQQQSASIREKVGTEYDLIKTLKLLEEKEIYEHSMRKRTRQAVDIIQQAVKTHKHVAVVAHCHTLCYLLAEQYDENDQPLPQFQPLNVTAYFKDCNKLIR